MRTLMPLTALLAIALGLSIWLLPPHPESRGEKGAEKPAEKTSKLEWPSFRGDPLLRGTARLSSPLTRPELVWSRHLEGPIEATVASVEGRVYVGTLDGNFYALELSTGKPIWKKTYKNSGFAASPLVHDGVIYVGDDLGEFHAFRASDGEPIWKLVTDAEIQSPASTDGERILFGGYDGQLYCVDRKGEILWKLETEGQVHSSPAIVEGKTFVSGCDQMLRVIDIGSGKEIGSLDLGGYTAASPAVVGDRVYVGTFSNQVVAVDWKKLEKVWHFEDERRKFPFYASCAVGEKLVIAAGRDKTIHALDRATGERRWAYRTRARVESSPVLVGEHVLAPSGDGNIYLLTRDGGKKVWTHEGSASFLASPAIARDRMIIGDEDGHIYCFDLVGGAALDDPSPGPTESEKS